MIQSTHVLSWRRSPPRQQTRPARPGRPLAAARHGSRSRSTESLRCLALPGRAARGRAEWGSLRSRLVRGCDRTRGPPGSPRRGSSRTRRAERGRASLAGGTRNLARRWAIRPEPVLEQAATGAVGIFGRAVPDRDSARSAVVEPAHGCAKPASSSGWRASRPSRPRTAPATRSRNDESLARRPVSRRRAPPLQTRLSRRCPRTAPTRANGQAVRPPPGAARYQSALVARMARVRGPLPARESGAESIDAPGRGGGVDRPVRLPVAPAIHDPDSIAWSRFSRHCRPSTTQSGSKWRSTSAPGRDTIGRPGRCPDRAAVHRCCRKESGC